MLWLELLLPLSRAVSSARAVQLAWWLYHEGKNLEKWRIIMRFSHRTKTCKKKTFEINGTCLYRIKVLILCDSSLRILWEIRGNMDIGYVKRVLWDEGGKTGCWNNQTCQSGSWRKEEEWDKGKSELIKCHQGVEVRERWWKEDLEVEGAWWKRD